MVRTLVVRIARDAGVVRTLVMLIAGCAGVVRMPVVRIARYRQRDSKWAWFQIEAGYASRDTTGAWFRARLVMPRVIPEARGSDERPLWNCVVPGKCGRREREAD